MDVKMIFVAFLFMVAIYGTISETKPISLVERCWCRTTVATVSQKSIRELRFFHSPNCAFQVIAKLRNNKEVCISPDTKWLQQYIEKALEQMKKTKRNQEVE